MNERTCVTCKKFRVESDRSYSEYTPGEGFAMYCTGGHFSVSGYEMDSETDFREYILKGQHCMDFLHYKRPDPPAIPAALQPQPLYQIVRVQPINADTFTRMDTDTFTSNPNPTC